MHIAAMRHHVLVVDAPSPRRAWLIEALNQRGFEASACDCADSAMAGLEGAAAAPPADLLLMRQASAVRDGLHLLKRIRAASPVPVVLIGNAMETYGDRVAALELGADDYLAAAMPVQEVLARIRAVLRRATLGPARPIQRPPAMPDDDRPIQGGWRLAAHRRALIGPDGEATIALTGAEFELLRLLTIARGEPVDRETISRSVFRRPWQIEDRAVDGLVKRLRRKLQDDAIASVRGIGYALRFDEAGSFVPGDTTSASASQSSVEICVHTSTVTNSNMQSAVVGFAPSAADRSRQRGV